MVFIWIFITSHDTWMKKRIPFLRKLFLIDVSGIWLDKIFEIDYEIMIVGFQNIFQSPQNFKNNILFHDFKPFKAAVW